MFNAWWKTSITAPDQLRQRVAFALSEIMVVSDDGPLEQQRPRPGRLLRHAARLRLPEFPRHPQAGHVSRPRWASISTCAGTRKGNLQTGLHPNENYAREIMQLFSFGLNRLWPDGTLVLDSKGNLIPTYDQAVIDGVSRVLTGWNYDQICTSTVVCRRTSIRPPTSSTRWCWCRRDMSLVPNASSTTSSCPPRAATALTVRRSPGSEADPAQVGVRHLLPAGSREGAGQHLQQRQRRAFRLPAVDSAPRHAAIRAPAICIAWCRSLTMMGPPQHVRGNMQAVIKAILLDGEARNTCVARSDRKYRRQTTRTVAPTDRPGARLPGRRHHRHL